MARFVLVPEFSRWIDAARDALAMESIEAVVVATPEDAAAEARVDDTLAVLADIGFPLFEDTCTALRAAMRTENTPVIGVARDPLRDDLARAFRLGITDYVTAPGIHQIRDRAVALSKGDPWGEVRAPSGRAMLAHADRSRRALLGRVLRQWGFDLGFAADEAELAAQVHGDHPPRIALIDGDLPPDGAVVALRRLRSTRSGSPVPCLVLADPKWLASTRTAVAEYAPAMTYDRSGPPENIVFAINDLLQGRAKEMRRSPRILHPAPASFWTDGNPELVWTYVYNISRSGLYIRTLVPPPANTVMHLQFRPPFGEGMVAMDAQVMWRKDVGSKAGPLYPTGMGVQFVRRPLADEAALNAGYEALLRESGQDGQDATSLPPLSGAPTPATPSS